MLVFSFKFCFAIAFNICAIYSDCVFIATAYWCCRHRRNVTPEVLRGEYKISGPYELKHTCIIHVKRTPKSYGKWTFFQSKVTCDFTFLQVIAILKLSIKNWKKKTTDNVSLTTQMLELKSLESENILQLLSKSFEQSSLQVCMGKQVEKINYHKCTGLEQKYRTILQCVLL